MASDLGFAAAFGRGVDLGTGEACTCCAAPRPIRGGEYGAGMDERPADLARTPGERAFLGDLLPERPWLDVWPREDADGTPWLCVSLDLTRDNKIIKTARIDFDGSCARGGWSPGFLNWDDGVRAFEAGIDVQGVDGLEAFGTPQELADAVGAWFDRHRSSWCSGSA